MPKLPLPIVSLGEAVTAGAVSALDTLPCGRSNQTGQLPLFSDDVSQNAGSLKQTSGTCQMSSSPLSLFRRYISSDLLAPISQLLELDPGLQELAEACFIKDSGHCDYSKFRTLSLRMSKGFKVVAPTQPQSMQLELFSDMRWEDGVSPKKHTRSRTQLRNSIKARISSASSGSLGSWGIAVLGSSETAGDGFPKTDPESSLLVVTGNVQCRKVEPNRPSLLTCLDSDSAVVINSGSQEPIDDSFTLKANSSRSGNQKHPTPSVLDQHPDGDRIYQKSAPSETSATHKLAVMFRAAGGDRIYTEESPTLRSLANTGGFHQGGSGAWKVVEYKGEEYAVPDGLPALCSTLAATEAYLKTGNRPRRVKDGRASLIPMGYRRLRPLSATEFERLMGWPVGCTEKGITASGKEITISKTQRQKMLGNGIIPHEIQDICLKLKPFLSQCRNPSAGPSRLEASCKEAGIFVCCADLHSANKASMQSNADCV